MPTPTRIQITLSPQDRFRLEALAVARDVSMGEAARRAILADYERTQEVEIRPRIEDPLVARLDGLAVRLAELEPLVNGTALRLLALIRCSKGRAEVEAEIARLVQS